MADLERLPPKDQHETSLLIPHLILSNKEEKPLIFKVSDVSVRRALFSCLLMLDHCLTPALYPFFSHHLDC